MDRDRSTSQNEMFPLLLVHQEMLAKYGPKHPKVLEIELKIKAVTEHLDSISASSVDAQQQEQMKPEQLLAKRSLRCDWKSRTPIFGNKAS